MKTTGYEPLFTLKAVAPDVWIADGPAIAFFGLPFPTRMTLIRLANGALFLHSPIAMHAGLRAEVEALGDVRHLVAPNWIHYAYLPAWKEAYPEAKLWAAPNVRERAEKYGVKFQIDQELTSVAPAEWSADIEQTIVEGSFLHREVVFFHRASKTLVLTDLIENFEAAKLPVWARPLMWLGGTRDPDGKAPLDMRLSFWRGRHALRNAVDQMIAWKPERIIIAHGRWYNHNGTQELRRAFRWASSSTHRIRPKGSE